MSVDAEIVDCSSREMVQTLYKRMGPVLMAKAYSMVRRQDVAAEMVQEAFLKLWKFGGVLPNERAVYVWLYRTCQRQCIDLARSAPHRLESTDTELLTWQSDGGSSSKRTIDRRILIDFLACLEERDADIFIYIELDGMTQQEVADLLGVARKTIQRSLLRTRSQLEEMIGRNE